MEPGDAPSCEGSGSLCRVVPSAEFATVAAAVQGAGDGTLIQVKPGHAETLAFPLILDHAVYIEGPADTSAKLEGEEGLIVAAGGAANTVVLSRLHLRVVGGGPALLLAGGCSVERCEIDTCGNGVGIEVAAHSGSAVQILRSVIRDCQVGISLAGGAAAAILEGTHIERCACGISLTGLDVEEGWSDALVSLSGASLALNSEADLRLRAWSIREKAGELRQAPPGREISACGWPSEQCNVVAPTDRGPVVLHFDAGKVNATLWDGEDDEVEQASTRVVVLGPQARSTARPSTSSTSNLSLTSWTESCEAVILELGQLASLHPRTAVGPVGAELAEPVGNHRVGEKDAAHAAQNTAPVASGYT